MCNTHPGQLKQPGLHVQIALARVIGERKREQSDRHGIEIGRPARRAQPRDVPRGTGPVQHVGWLQQGRPRWRQTGAVGYQMADAQGFKRMGGELERRPDMSLNRVLRAHEAVRDGRVCGQDRQQGRGAAQGNCPFDAAASVDQQRAVVSHKYKPWWRGGRQHRVHGRLTRVSVRRPGSTQEKQQEQNAHERKARA